MINLNTSVKVLCTGKECFKPVTMIVVTQSGSFNLIVETQCRHNLGHSVC